MAKNPSRSVTIYVNGKQVENTVQSLRAELKKLENQQKRTTIQSEEYIRVTPEIERVKNIIKDATNNAKNLGDEWKSTVEKAAEYSNFCSFFKVFIPTNGFSLLYRRSKAHWKKAFMTLSVLLNDLLRCPCSRTSSIYLTA